MTNEGDRLWPDRESTVARQRVLIRSSNQWSLLGIDAKGFSPLAGLLVGKSGQKEQKSRAALGGVECPASSAHGEFMPKASLIESTTQYYYVNHLTSQLVVI
jgi:hypothetical protein